MKFTPDYISEGDKNDHLLHRQSLLKISLRELDQLPNFEVTLYSFMIVEDQLTIIDGWLKELSHFIQCHDPKKQPRELNWASTEQWLALYGYGLISQHVMIAEIQLKRIRLGKSWMDILAVIKL
ncbi:hypothetical protein KY285_021451 [Solanum tuberosum]|nr:hypothetical protein KY285_021451 [Solanum tuberosum]